METNEESEKRRVVLLVKEFQGMSGWSIERRPFSSGFWGSVDISSKLFAQNTIEHNIGELKHPSSA